MGKVESVSSTIKLLLRIIYSLETTRNKVCTIERFWESLSNLLE